MIDVFLSYRRETATECCSILQERLSAEGLKVFFDYHSLRQGNFEEQIDRAIEECTFVLIVLAERKDLERCLQSPNKDWILHEISLAIEYGKIVIPVVFKQNFSFPNNTDNEILQYLAHQEICDISGPEMSSLIATKLFDFMNDIPASKLKKEYIEGIRSKDFLEWESKTLQNIYSSCDLLESFGQTVPIVIKEGSDTVKYPFDALNDKQNLEAIGEPIAYKDFPYYRDFKKIIGPNIHYPNLYGFTNTGIILDSKGKVAGFHAKPRQYKETVYTGHILHYELWRVFQELGKDSPATLKDLPMREAFHKGVSEHEALFSGCKRSSLADVCVAILAYDEIEEDYDIAVATRSENVTCYPGYLSIVPSGGFELYELETKQNEWVINNNFSIIAALYREYIEEVFGNENFSKPTGNDDLKRLYRNEHIKMLRKGIGNTYHFEFLGVVMDVIAMRPTFSFVLRIDNPDFLYNNEICKNEENIDIRFVSLSKFDNMITSCAEQSPMMPESAGVYELLKKNHLYTEVVPGD